MKRLLFVVTAAVALVAIPGTASAHEGHTSCQAFGAFVSGNAQNFGGLGEIVSGFAPVSDEVAFEHEVHCTSPSGN
jgi:hypothetical protein